MYFFLCLILTFAPHCYSYVSPEILLQECTTWGGMEGCCHNLYLKKTVDYDCKDTPWDFPIKCPSILSVATSTFCENFKTTCKQSCAMCGRDAYLTAKDIDNPSTPGTACKSFWCKEPYHCMRTIRSSTIPTQGIIMQIYVDNFRNKLTSAPLNLGCAFTNKTLCFRLDYRRRFTFDHGVMPKKWSDIKMCFVENGERTETTSYDTCLTVSGRKNVLLSSFENTDARISNHWMRLSIKPFVDEDLCNNDRYIVIEIDKGVDWLDIDNMRYSVDENCVDEQVIDVEPNLDKMKYHHRRV